MTSIVHAVSMAMFSSCARPPLRPNGRCSTSTARTFIIEKVPPDDPEHDLVGRLLAVSFAVDDIDAAYRDLTAKGVSFPQPPEKQGWGGTLAFPRDPDGNILTLVG